MAGALDSMIRAAYTGRVNKSAEELRRAIARRNFGTFKVAEELRGAIAQRNSGAFKIKPVETKSFGVCGERGQ